MATTCPVCSALAQLRRNEMKKKKIWKWKYEKREIMSMDKECNTADDAQIYQISSRHKPGMRSPASFSS